MFQFSPEDADLVASRAWSPNAQGYMHCATGQFHRFVGERVAGRKLGFEELVDHRNCDKLDCRRENLRIVDRSKNGQNRIGAQANNLSSGIRGVTWDASRNRWKVQAKVRDFRVQRRFEKLEDAAAFVTRFWAIAEETQDATELRRLVN